MSYPSGQASSPGYGIASPPAPPPKPPPPLPPHPTQHKPSPPQYGVPVRNPSLNTGPAAGVSLNSSDYANWASAWRAPYPPEDGLARSTPDQIVEQQQQSTYRGQYYEPRNWHSPHEPQIHEADSKAQYDPRQRPNPLDRQQSYQHQPQPYQEQYQLPTNIQSKTIADLSILLADQQLLTALIQSPDIQPSSLQNSTARLNSQLAANIELAKTLSKLHETLYNERAKTSANLLRLRGLETAWKKKQTDLERKLEPWGPRELHQRLAAAITEGDGMCGALETSFIDSTGGAGESVADEREVADWIRRVREGRRIVALRRERKRRWDEGRVGGWR